VVFFDEPMSGLDPIGRRDIRQLILGLRDRGCTVFFSSHVLSDAEALCSRVAILAGGRLAAEGELSDLLAFRVRGWELVAAGVGGGLVERLRTHGAVSQVRAIGGDRYAMELPVSSTPEGVMAEIISQGGQIVSLNPVRDTLEDLFVRKVAEAPHAAREVARP
jgi:ABC-2 type transport system ATP-binding protein